jgi:drug/metabolite transporter (DMT)-like permease
MAFFIAKGVPLPKGKEWITVIILSLLNFVLSNGLSNWGVQYISAGLGAIIGAIFPLWIVIIGFFYEHFDDFFDSKFRFGIILSLIATWTWAFGTLYTKKNANSFNPYFSLGLQMMISGTLLLVITGTINSPEIKSFVPFTSIPWQSWLCIAYLVVFGSLIAFVAYLYALQNLPTEQASIYAYINPIVAVLLGWIIFNEHLTLFIGIGGAVALLGVFLVNKAFKAIPPPEQPEAEGM